MHFYSPPTLSSRPSIRIVSGRPGQRCQLSKRNLTSAPKSPREELTALVVPHPDTRPPPFASVKRDPDATSASYYWALGKAYKNFYWAAVKQLFRVNKLSRSLRTKDRSSPPGKSRTLQARSYAAYWESQTICPSTASPAITRAEWQVIARNRDNIKCVPPFLLLITIFGEWTPLIAPFALRIIPFVGKTPAMIEQEREGLEKRRKEMLRSGVGSRILEEGKERREIWEASKEDPKTLKKPEVGREKEPGFLPSQWRVSKSLSGDELFAVSTALDISTRQWSYLERLPFIPILRRRVHKALELLAIDDSLIVRALNEARGVAVTSADDLGMPNHRELIFLLAGLPEDELQLMAVARGIDVVRRSKDVLAQDLAAWFYRRKTGYETVELLLRRPVRPV